MVSGAWKIPTGQAGRSGRAAKRPGGCRGRGVGVRSPLCPRRSLPRPLVRTSCSLAHPPLIRRKPDLVRSGHYIAASAAMTDSATTITPKPNGPLLVQGPVRILAPDGTELAVPPRKDGRPAEVVVALS